MKAVLRGKSVELSAYPPPPNKQKSLKRSHISYLMMHLKSLEKEEISEKRRWEETND